MVSPVGSHASPYETQPLLARDSDETITITIGGRPKRGLAEAIQKVQAVQRGNGASATGLQSAAAYLKDLQRQADVDPAFRANVKRVKASIDTLSNDLEKSLIPASMLSKATVVGAAVGAWGLTMYQAGQAFNDVDSNGLSDGQFVTQFGAQGSKIGAVCLSALFQKPNNESVLNILRNYALPNAIASTMFAAFDEQKQLPFAVTGTLVGTIGALSSIEAIARLRADSDGRRTPLEGPGVDFLRSVAQAIVGDLRGADTLIRDLTEGKMPDGLQVDRVGITESNNLETVHRLLEDAQSNLVSQTGLAPEPSHAGVADRVAGWYLIALQMGIGLSSVALTKNPIDTYSSLADVLSVGLAMTLKNLTGATENAMTTTFKDLMSLSMLWLPIQAANRAAADQDGAGFLDKQEVENVAATAAGLSLMLLTIAGPTTSVLTDILRQPVDGATALYRGLRPALEDAPAAGSDSAPSGAGGGSGAKAPSSDSSAELELSTRAALRLEAGEAGPAANELPGEAGAGPSDAWPAHHLHDAVSTLTGQAMEWFGGKMGKLKEYLGDTFDRRKFEAMGLVGAKTDADIAQAKNDTVNDLNRKLQEFSAFLDAITDGSPPHPGELDAAAPASGGPSSDAPGPSGIPGPSATAGPSGVPGSSGSKGSPPSGPGLPARSGSLGLQSGAASALSPSRPLTPLSTTRPAELEATTHLSELSPESSHRPTPTPTRASTPLQPIDEHAPEAGMSEATGASPGGQGHSVSLMPESPPVSTADALRERLSASAQEIQPSAPESSGGRQPKTSGEASPTRLTEASSDSGPSRPADKILLHDNPLASVGSFGGGTGIPFADQPISSTLPRTSGSVAGDSSSSAGPSATGSVAGDTAPSSLHGIAGDSGDVVADDSRISQLASSMADWAAGAEPASNGAAAEPSASHGSVASDDFSAALATAGSASTLDPYDPVGNDFSDAIDSSLLATSGASFPPSGGPLPHSDPRPPMPRHKIDPKEKAPGDNS